MNRTDKHTPDTPADQDIHDLLNNGQTPVPEVVSQRIREAAATKADQVRQAREQRRQRQIRTSRWLATAASIVVVVALAPMLMQEPESRSPSQILQQALDDSAPADTTLPDALFRDGRPVPEGNALTAASRASPSSLADIADAAERMKTTQAFDAPLATYRSARTLDELPLPDKALMDDAPAWEERIRGLLNDGQIQQARREYTALREHHPDYTPRLKPRFAD